MNNALIVFIKNPVLGKVKTRLAKTVGDVKALEIYQKLLTHTRVVSEVVEAERFIYYSDFINPADEWRNFTKHLQSGNDLGERMSNAFAEIFDLGYTGVIIIGSDCMEINAAIIGQAFDELGKHDIVIGPAADGGYYLLGMKHLYKPLFANKSWSTETVLPQTIADIITLGLSYKPGPVLNDIDDEKSLQNLNLSVV